VVALNRAVALAEVDGPAAALATVEGLARDGRLAGYPYLAAARAEMLRRLGRAAEAADQYRTALTQTDNEAERAYLRAQIALIAAA
jgi:RNA polymerase sigma-70 factor (ECF subfamily)